MPKLRRYASDYRGRQIDISIWVLKQMKLNHLNQTDIANELGITQQKVSVKLDVTKDTWFNLLEVMKLIDFFKASDKEVVKLIKA